jgi:hypothetical protein
MNSRRVFQYNSVIFFSKLIVKLHIYIYMFTIELIYQNYPIKFILILKKISSYERQIKGY